MLFFEIIKNAILESGRQEVTGSTPVFSTKSTDNFGAFFVYVPMDYFVYIIYSQTLDRYYIGHCQNIQERIQRLN
ncbi:hypothetical protein B7P33_17305 [Sediminicola luteus]|uniref:GIY-YIG domain-containing protein n=1 Tax=Sediminicola luteus TaxID=319238 RepID=A0A2A4G3M3_9FLAO|nr:hypothetical protein B7P33_17305 [Sediminicola luteus]